MLGGLATCDAVRGEDLIRGHKEASIMNCLPVQDEPDFTPDR